MKTTALAALVFCVLQGCLWQEKEDPCWYQGLPEGRVPASDTLIVRAILDSNGLDSLSASRVAWRIGELNFSYAKLDSFHFPPIAAQLQSIREMSFDDNRLKRVPRNISLIKGVTYLYLHDNLIDSVPDELFSMVQLKHLYLNNNLLTGLSPKIANLKSLMYLNLSQNSLFSLPLEITRISASLNGCGQPAVNVFGNYLCTLPTGVISFLNRYSDKNWRQFQVCPQSL